MKNEYSSGILFKTIKNKLSNGSRQFLVYNFAGLLNLNLVIEYPKSGGTWLGQLVSSCLGIPFPRNRMPLLKRSLLHGHFLPIGNIGKAENIFFMVRDGRDVMVSMYYHFLIWNEKNKLHPKDILYYRKKLGFKDYDDIKENLTDFIDFVFTDKPSKLIKFRHEGTWRDFNEKWLNFIEDSSGNIVVTSYESLLMNPETELKSILFKIGIEQPDQERIKKIVEEFSFANQAGRNQGVEDAKNFLRKGITGDWKNKFTKKSASVFDHYAGDMLIRLGYEKNSSWVDLQGSDRGS